VSYTAHTELMRTVCSRMRVRYGSRWGVDYRDGSLLILCPFINWMLVTFRISSYILTVWTVVTGVSYSNDSEHAVTAAAHFFDLGGRATCSHYSGNYLIGFEHCVTDYRARRVFGVPARRQLSTRISFSVLP
jgi:hypothetical protein